MQVYIKNSKMPLPTFVRGIITQVRDYSAPPKDSLGNQPVCAYLYWRHTSTGRRVWFGRNRWDLFTIVPHDEYIVTEEPDVVLGRYNGHDIGFTLRRVVAPEVVLPNGTTLPADTVTTDLRFLSLQPMLERATENSILDAFDALPFTQRIDDNRIAESLPADLWEREFVSYFAHEYPAAYRVAADPLAAAKEVLLPESDAA